MENQTNLTKKERRELKRQNKNTENMHQSNTQKTKKYMTRTFVTLIAIVTVVGLWNLSQRDTAPVLMPNEILQIQSDDWVKGDVNAKVVLIEYSDFECPACRSYHPLLKKLADEFANDIAFVYRHFPLRQIHQNAQLAGQAAEAAGKQGKFWEMHDLIFENQSEWSKKRNRQAEDIFISYAESLNLSIEQFNTDINSKETKDKVNNDYKGGIRMKVNSTPSFFLNGEKIQNPRGYEEFKALIDKALKE